MRDFCYRVCYVLVRAAMFFWHPTLRVTGVENLPKGAAVLCANHAGAADPLWIILRLNQPSLFRIMAKSELRKVPFVGWLMERFGMIFVRRGGHDTAAVEQCVQALRGGEKLLVFLEGTRCNGGKHVRPRTGAIRIAAASGAPIVPVYVTRDKKLFGPIDVMVGRPQTPLCAPDAEHARLQKEADALLYSIYRMGGDSYADHVGENGGLLLRS